MNIGIDAQSRAIAKRDTGNLVRAIGEHQSRASADDYHRGAVDRATVASEKQMRTASHRQIDQGGRYDARFQRFDGKLGTSFTALMTRFDSSLRGRIGLAGRSPSSLAGAPVEVSLRNYEAGFGFNIFSSSGSGAIPRSCAF